MNIDFSQLPVKVVVGGWDELIATYTSTKSAVIYGFKDIGNQLTTSYLATSIISCITRSINTHNAPPGGLVHGKIDLPMDIDFWRWNRWTPAEIDIQYEAGINPIRHYRVYLPKSGHYDKSGLYLWGQFFWTKEGDIQQIYNPRSNYRYLNVELLGLLPLGLQSTAESR